METPFPTKAKQPLYLEDLQPGQRFISPTHQLDAEQVIAYARQFDPQPFHTDPEAAKQTFFHGLVASGWHTAAISMRLLTESGFSISGGIIGAGVEITWPKPTAPDSLLHIECEIKDLRTSRSRPERGIVTVRSETKNQLGEVVQVLVAKLIVPCRPSAT